MLKSPLETTNSPAHSATEGSVWKVSLILAFFFICGALLLEGSIRLRQYHKYGTVAGTMYHSHIDTVSGLPVPIPGQNTSHIWINSLGFRSPEIAAQKPQATVRLAFLGASTTFCAEVSSNEATWPYLVWQTLRRSWPGVNFEFINAGVVGYTTDSSLLNWQRRVAPLDPDVVVLYEGINDFTKDVRALAERQGLPTGVVGPGSFLERHSVAWHLIATTVKLKLRNRETAKPLRFTPADLDGQGFYDRLSRLVGEVERGGRLVVLPTISIRLREQQSPEEQRRAAEWGTFYTPFMTPEGLIMGYSQYNAVIQRVAGEHAAVLAGDEAAIPADDTHFKDFVHFTDQGCVLMAQRVVNALRSDVRFQRIIASRRAAVISRDAAKTGKP